MQIDSGSVPDSEIAARVFAKQVDLLYKNQGFALISTVAILFMLFSYLSFSVELPVLVGWFILFIVVIVSRLVIGRVYFLNKRSNTVNVRESERIYTFGTVLSGLVWGMMSIILLPELDVKGKVLLIIVIFAFTAAAYGTMGYRKLPIYSFIVIILTPLIAAVHISDMPNEAALITTIILYMVYMLYLATLFYKNTHRMLWLQEVAIDRESELVQQREKAESANETKSVFLSRMSHELRTPLNAIMGLSELQLLDKNSPLSEKQELRTKKINNAGKHLLSIVDDVLDFSRIEIGNLEICLQPVRLLDVIKHSITMVEDIALQRNVSITCELSFPDIYVTADNKRLNQVLVNLLDNAVKYNKNEGSVTVGVKAIDEKTVQLSVVDTGYGLSTDSTQELFVPFSRLGAEESGINGTGIGLSLCKQLVELMNGEIGVDSQQEVGCCFWVRLPLSEHSEVTLDAEDQNTGDQKTLLPYGAIDEQKILLVEDNVVNCEVAVDMLQGIGLDVDIAHDGKQAVEMNNSNQYRLILMDCEMPVMDGFAATRVIRRTEFELQQEPVPIIALTAHAISGAREKCISGGMDDFLCKPFNMASLYALLDRWLNVEVTTEALQKSQNNTDDSHQVASYEFRCDSTVLDCAILSKLYNKQNKDNSSIMINVIQTYLDQSEMLLSSLADNCKKSETESVRRILHTLKSSSIHVGAIRLSEICKKLEHASAKGVIDDSLLRHLQQSYSDVEIALNVVLRDVRNTVLSAI